MKVQTTVTLVSGCEAVASGDITAEPPRTAYEYDLDGVMAVCQCCGREFDLIGRDEELVEEALLKAANRDAEDDYFAYGEWKIKAQQEAAS